MSEYETWGKYYHYEGHVTHQMLNKEYGDAGMFFKTYAEAQVRQMQVGGKIYTIRNYYHSAFEDGRKLRKDAKPYVEGYYVSHPPELKLPDKVYQFRGK